jgi:CheY-like chemotaxis protein
MDPQRYELCDHVVPPRKDTPSSLPHILIVEDNPAIKELLDWVLGLAGYRTTVCAGGQTALTWIDETVLSGERFALILIELSFSVANALDSLHHLRTHWYNVYGTLPQVIVLTTSKQVQEALAPMERVILNPFHIQELLTLIQQVIQ